MYSEDVFIARQPILDSEQRIYGYELLFRSKNEDFAEVSDDFAATAQVMISTLNTFGIDKLLNEKKGFINVNHDVLHNNIFEPLNKDKFILEILEDTQMDIYLIEKVRQMREEGYRFALDDFIFDTEFADYFEPLFPYISIIKVDMIANNKQDIQKKFKLFQGHKILWLAEKVEDQKTFEFCKNLGFTYFQGFFFAKPTVIEGKQLEPSRLAVIQLVNILQKDPDIQEVESVFKSYPELTINLLRFINSAAHGLRSEIKSVRQAIALIGQKKLLQWLLLMMYAGAQQDKPNPIFYTASQRAKAMENFLRHSLKENRQSILDEAFLVGLLSLLDVLFQAPLNEVLSDLHLNTEISEAILGHKGTLGKLLLLIEKTETSSIKLEEIMKILNELNLSLSELTQVSLESYAWTENMV